VTTLGSSTIRSVPAEGQTAVLGASGWIGREVFRLARQLGPAVGATRRADLPGHLTVSNERDLEHLIQCHDVMRVVNCTGVTEGADVAMTRANVDYAEAVGQVCLRNNVRLVHVGSAAEYGGGAESAIRETSPTEPCSRYGQSKLAGTQALLQLADGGLDVTVARPFNVVGAGQSMSTPIGEFAAAVRAMPSGGGDVAVRDSSLVRDFVSKTFVANALLAIVYTGGGPVLVNVCSGRGLSFADFILAMADVQGKRVRIVNTQPGGIPRVVGDPTVLRTLVGQTETEGIEQLARQVVQPAQ
jgi:nucleoside-diphosphate-sugar epimerase